MLSASSSLMPSIAHASFYKPRIPSSAPSFLITTCAPGAPDSATLTPLDSVQHALFLALVLVYGEYVHGIVLVVYVSELYTLFYYVGAHLANAHADINARFAVQHDHRVLIERVYG